MQYKNVHKIMVLGDSISKGVMLSKENGRYIFSPHRFLTRLDADISPAITDHSKFGTTTEHGKTILDRKLSLERPDLVLIEYGSNDSDYHWDEIAKNPTGTHLPNLSLQAYGENLRQLIHCVQDSGAICVLTNLHPLAHDRYFQWFTKGDPDKQKNTLRWLKSTKYIYWWQEMYSYMAERIALEEKVSILNIRGAFLRHPDYVSLLCEDGIHPNDLGHALLYETFLFYIRRSASSWLD